jgi:hypothetical protein
MFNNIFWDNRAGSWNGQYVTGIGSPQAPAADPVVHWDMGSIDPGITLRPTYTLLQQLDPGVLASPTNKIGLDPKVKLPFDTSATILVSRTFPSFREAVIVAANVPPTLLGDYHLLNATSPASGAGTRQQIYGAVTVPAPALDYDGDTRFLPAPEAGADELP